MVGWWQEWRRRIRDQAPLVAQFKHQSKRVEGRERAVLQVAPASLSVQSTVLA